MSKGTVKYIAPIKRFGKLHSLGIKFEEDEEKDWHNIVGFSMQDIKFTLNTAKVGDEVEYREETNEQGYTNIVEVKILKATAQTELKDFDDKTEAKKLQKECIDDAISLYGEDLANVGINPNDIMEGLRRSRISFNIEKNKRR